jgi:type VI secretion system Hcp family effector
MSALPEAVLKPNMFIRVMGAKTGKVKGEWDTASTGSHAHEVGDIQILSWSWGVRSPTDTWQKTPTGRRQYLELRVRKRVDTSTPVLYSVLSTNESLTWVKLLVFKAGASLEDAPYLALLISDARVTSMSTSPGEGAETHELFDQMTLAFRKVRMSYNAQLPDGSLGPEIAYEDSFD